MTNYPYLIASLPDFQPDCEPHSFDHAALVAFLKANCPARDARRIDWLEAGLEPAHLGHLFYAGVARSRCRFLREFFAFDRRVREAKVAFLAGEPLPEGPVEERAQLEGLFAVKNILEREKQWDRLYWQKADELTQFNLFDIDVVLAFLVKAHTVARWNALDPVDGAELFSQLVNEVRGTFSGVNYDPNTP